MLKKKKTLLTILLGVIILTQSGCSLLALPFNVLGELLKIISKLPKPPPGVF